MSQDQAVLADEAFARKLQEEEDARMAQSMQDVNITPSQPANGVPASSRAAVSDASGPVPLYTPPPGLPPPPATNNRPPPPDTHVHHTNQLIQVSQIRAKDEQHMQNWRQQIQFRYGIYNSELEPEHESDYPCMCEIHQYQRAKWNRSHVQDMWNEAVLYPGEKAYNSNRPYNSSLFSGNPYQYKTISPYFGTFNMGYGPKQANASAHAKWTAQCIALNDSLNKQAQASIDAREPRVNIWGEKGVPAFPQDKKEGIDEKENGGWNDDKKANGLSNGDNKTNGGWPNDTKANSGWSDEKKGHHGGDNSGGLSASDEKAKLAASEKSEKYGYPSEKVGTQTQTGPSAPPPPPLSTLPPPPTNVAPAKTSKFASFRKSVGIKSSTERQVAKAEKDVASGDRLRNEILQEENSRWPNPEWREIVRTYQQKTGMASKIAFVRVCQPIQYLHLLRAGYFEPIPVAWANQASNPLKFSIEATSGWRGITPAWRGYEDTAEERLYWVLNHREGSTGTRLKPDFISAINLALERMSKAVEPPPQYYDASDTCHTQHKTDGYSKQVMPPPFRPFDRPETSSDDTMILLDVSGSMDFTPQRPRYDRYLVTGYDNTNQPKNKDLAKAIIRRFVDAMSNHDHNFTGYDLTTFSSSAKYVGTINHRNLDALWSTIKIGGGTRVMTGWQKVKDLHFKKHSHSAIHHPIYGWQAGPDTPMLRLLLLLDGEATDMDEFELDLLGLSWAHVTIFLIGVDGCPHHHRHANELQRISDVNHHVSFVDAQGNTPERFVTHELLKRHLGYDVSMAEFQELEVPPAYTEEAR